MNNIGAEFVKSIGSLEAQVSNLMLAMVKNTIAVDSISSKIDDMILAERLERLALEKRVDKVEDTHQKAIYLAKGTVIAGIPIGFIVAASSPKVTDLVIKIWGFLA